MVVHESNFTYQRLQPAMSHDNHVQVCYVFRKSRPGFFSIEKIFSRIAEALRSDITIKLVYVPHSRLLPWNILQNFRYIRKEHARIYHITGDVHYLAMGLPRRRTILTIHDCVFMYRETGFKRWALKQLFLTWPVRHCHLITTISEQSRKDIIRFTGCSPEKVIVIPNPVDDHFFFKEKEFNKQCPVLLFVGTAQHKNLSRVIPALKGISCILDIIGRISEEHLRMLKEAAINFRQSSNLSPQELASRYVECDLVLFPSTFEGFGLPVIEAQRSGRPVVTSNISPMKEVAGKGALLVDPFDIQAIRAGILQVIDNQSIREKLVQNGFKNIEEYLPEKIAGRYNELYQGQLSGKKH